MSHMLRILDEIEAQDLEKIAEESDSILVKVACGLANSDNPILMAVRASMENSPPANLPELKGMLTQLAQMDIQKSINKIQSDEMMSTVRMEADRVRAMADLMREKLSMMRYMREMQELQAEMGAQQGMATNNVAVQTAGTPPGISGPEEQAMVGAQGEEPKPGLVSAPGEGPTKAPAPSEGK